MGDKPNAVSPVTPIRKAPRPLTPPAGSPQDVRELKPAGVRDATDVQSQKPFASPGKLMDGKPQPVAAPAKPTRFPEPTD